jgi:exosortase A
MSDVRNTGWDRGLRIYLLVLAVGAVATLIHWRTFADMVSLWSLMPYRHGYLIFPVAAYFLWQRRPELAAQPVSGSLVGILALAILSAIWLVARATAVQVVEQLVVVLMIPALVLAMLGPAVFRTAAFPLLLLVVAVPAGEALVPGLMSATAGIAEWLLLAFGVPVFRQGLVMTVPSGAFEVAVICAGLNYLLAGVVTAIVFAQQAFAGWGKRLAFVGLAAAGFVMANGVRVFLVIYLHFRSGGRIFSHDHVWFRMVVFGVTLVLLLVLGTRFSDPGAKPRRADRQKPQVTPRLSSLMIAAGAIIILAAGPVLAARQGRAVVSGEIQWPALPTIEGCEGPQSWAADWGPFMLGSDVERSGTYACGDLQVDVFVAVYASQGQGKELISAENELVPEYIASRGRTSRRSFQSDVGTTVATSEIAVAGQPVELVWTWYSVGGASATSGLHVKMLEVIKVLRLDDAPSVLYVVAARGGGEPADELRPTIESAASALWDATAQGRTRDAP